MKNRADAAGARSSTTRSSRSRPDAPDAPLRMLQSKAVAGETALDVLDVAMRVGGGAAFRKDIGIERHFRDARASAVMAPDARRAAGLHRAGALRHCRCSGEGHDDAHRRPFTLGAVAYDPKVVTIWEGFTDWFATHDFAFDYVLYSNYEAQAEAHLAGARRRHLGLAAGLGAHPAAGRGRRAASAGRWRCATPTRTSPRSCSSAPTATSPTSPSSPGARSATGARRLAAGDAAPARPPRRARASTPARRSPCAAST